MYRTHNSFANREVNNSLHNIRSAR